MIRQTNPKTRSPAPLGDELGGVEGGDAEDAVGIPTVQTEEALGGGAGASDEGGRASGSLLSEDKPETPKKH